MKTMRKPKAASVAPKAAAKHRVFLVDDHPIVRQGLAQLINHEADLAVVGEGDNAYACLREIVSCRPDLVLADVSLRDSDGIELVKELKNRLPDLPILVLSMHDELLYAERALRAGASGYIMKQEAPQTLLSAMRAVLGGNVYTSAKMGAALLKRMVGARAGDGGLPLDRLSDRELEVLRMIGAGRTVKQIADDLYLSAKTVEAHREHIKEKLNIKSSAELLRYAIHNLPDA